MTASLARIDALAKINLALHVTGQRDDGYHEIETIAVFADIGDRITAENAGADSFKMTGPESAALAGEDTGRNLVIRARDMLREIIAEAEGNDAPVDLTLEKNLPAGGGIGGGSADAAATLHALSSLWSCVHLAETIAERAIRLGADVPMCLRSTPLVATGIGEFLTPVATMPSLAVVLANPHVHVSTPAVFAALGEKRNPPLPIDGTRSLTTVRDWAEFLKTSTRNDLQAPSVLLDSQIAVCLAALEETDALLVRMSGSGATCFGVYRNAAQADHAASHLLRLHPDWWIKSCMTGPSDNQAA